MNFARTTGSQLDLALGGLIGYRRRSVREVLEQSAFRVDTPGSWCMRCGDSVGQGEQTATGCGSCRRHSPVADHVLRLGPYVDDLRLWILQVKFGRWSAMGIELGSMLGEALKGQLEIGSRRTVLVPVPMPWPRRLYRGIDHTKMISRGVARQLRVPILPLLATRNGPPQISLSHSERQRQGGRRLHIRRGYESIPLKQMDVILIDDVRTTGATLRAARRLLEPYKPRRVIAAVLAVSDAKAREWRARAASDRGDRRVVRPSESVGEAKKAVIPKSDESKGATGPGKTKA